MRPPRGRRPRLTNRCRGHRPGAASERHGSTPCGPAREKITCRPRWRPHRPELPGDGAPAGAERGSGSQRCGQEAERMAYELRTGTSRSRSARRDLPCSGRTGTNSPGPGSTSWRTPTMRCRHSSSPRRLTITTSGVRGRKSASRSPHRAGIPARFGPRSSRPFFTTKPREGRLGLCLFRVCRGAWPAHRRRERAGRARRS